MHVSSLSKRISWNENEDKMLHPSIYIYIYKPNNHGDLLPTWGAESLAWLGWTVCGFTEPARQKAHFNSCVGQLTVRDTTEANGLRWPEHFKMCFPSWGRQFVRRSKWTLELCNKLCMKFQQMVSQTGPKEPQHHQWWEKQFFEKITEWSSENTLL